MTQNQVGMCYDRVGKGAMMPQASRNTYQKLDHALSSHPCRRGHSTSPPGFVPWKVSTNVCGHQFRAMTASKSAMTARPVSGLM